MRERGLGKLRKASLSGRACGVRRQVSLVGRMQLATSTECQNNKNPTIHPKGNRDPSLEVSNMEGVIWTGKQFGRNILVISG